MMRLKLTTMSAALLAAVVCGSAAAFAQSAGSANSVQVPQPDPSAVNWKGVGIGAGTVAGNVLYIPAKLVYGILGGIGGGAGYALTGGNEQVANTIWRSSLGGDYVLTPDMISGKQPVHFSGPTGTAQPASGAANEPNNSSAFASSTSPVVAPPTLATAPIDSGAGPLGAGSAVSSEPIGGTAKPAPGLSNGAGGSTAKSAPPPSSTSIE
jgi:opacity protein-like surface antigen